MGGSGFNKSEEESNPIFKQFAGAFGGAGNDYTKSSELGGQLQEMLGDRSFMDQGFGPQNANEQNLLNSLMDVTAGRGAVRGLGAPTQSSLAASIAPTLVDMRQQGISNQLGARGQDIAGLSELIGLAMPQLIGGQQSTGSGKGYKSAA